jgi:hypothetical protein
LVQKQGEKMVDRLEMCEREIQVEVRENINENNEEPG